MRHPGEHGSAGGLPHHRGIGIGIVSIVCALYLGGVARLTPGTDGLLYQLAVTVGFLGAYLMNYYLLKQSASFSSSIPCLP